MTLDERQLSQIRGLTDISRRLTYASSLPEVLKLTVERATELFGASRAILVLMNSDGTLVPRASVGISVTQLGRLPSTLDGELATRLAELLDVPSFLGVPLVICGAVQGFLAVGVSPQQPEGGGHDEWLLSALADQAALALERSNLDEGSLLRERLIGIVGHDLRGPLGAILMAADVVLSDHRVDQEVQRLAGRVQSSARRMGRILDQLVDFTRVRMGGGVPLSLELCELGEICHDVVDELRTGHPRATIVLSGPDAPVVVEWDRARIAQVLTNLTSNAIQHGAAGTPVTVTCAAGGDTITVAVHNRGTPIPHALQRVIFDPFRRVADRPDIASNHLGLGLYIAQQIARAHGGDVSVHSSPETGTTFLLSLPRRPPEVASVVR